VGDTDYGDDRGNVSRVSHDGYRTMGPGEDCGERE
jgi:hypothetical protein